MSGVSKKGKTMNLAVVSKRKLCAFNPLDGIKSSLVAMMLDNKKCNAICDDELQSCKKHDN